jgi:hypothetical protein
MPPEERAAYQASMQSIERARDARPAGFNAFWLCGTPNTLEILQYLGFVYYIHDASRDEPFTVAVKGKPFAVVPYSLHMNHIVDDEGRYFSAFRSMVATGRLNSTGCTPNRNIEVT